MWKINWFARLDTSKKTCEEFKMFFLNILERLKWLALPVAIVDDGIVMKRV